MSWYLLPALLLGACSRGERKQALLASPSFRARTLTVAATRGSRGQGAEISRELVRRLKASGLAASALEESDSVLSGSALGLESAMNPGLLDEVRRATGADAIVFLSLNTAWSALEVSALDARTGDVVLRSTARPRGDAFAGPPDIAAAAERSLSPLADARRAAPAGGLTDEIPLP